MKINEQLFYQHIQRPLSVKENDSSQIKEIIQRDNSKQDIAATFETNTSSPSRAKGILYRKEQFINPRAVTQPIGEKIELSPRIKDMKRSEIELNNNSSDEVSNEAMDAFLRKAFRLFDL